MSGIPAGFADGVDDGGSGGASYSAGAGLALNGQEFSVNLNTVQARVQSCAPSLSIRAINMDGSVECEADDVGEGGGGGDITGINVGTGLSGGGVSGGINLAVDTATIQARVTATCPAGASIRAIASDGSVTCEADDTSAAAVAALQTQVTTLQGQVGALQTLLAGLSRSGNDLTFTSVDVVISGANLQVISGSGATNGTPNGQGNVIIGYNESRGANDVRTGSHMLVVGQGHNYNHYGGIVVGLINSAMGPYASVSGGYQNTASSFYASVSGGFKNSATAANAVVSGGFNNSVNAVAATIGGGTGDTIANTAGKEYDWQAGDLIEAE